MPVARGQGDVSLAADDYVVEERTTEEVSDLTESADDGAAASSPMLSSAAMRCRTDRRSGGIDRDFDRRLAGGHLNRFFGDG